MEDKKTEEQVVSLAVGMQLISGVMLGVELVRGGIVIDLLIVRLYFGVRVDG